MGKNLRFNCVMSALLLSVTFLLVATNTSSNAEPIANSSNAQYEFNQQIQTTKFQTPLPQNDAVGNGIIKIACKGEYNKCKTNSDCCSGLTCSKIGAYGPKLCN